MENWKQTAESYQNKISALNLQQFEILSSVELKITDIENQLQKLHLIEQQINLIIDELNKSLQEDQAREIKKSRT